MTEIYQKFQRDSERKAFDLEHRIKINFNISKYNAAVEKGKSLYSNQALAKKRASSIKHKVINNLDQYLVDFVANFEKNGGKVIWAPDAGDATREILEIINKHKGTRVVKSKSMITEEIELNEFLEKNKIHVL